MSDGKLYMVRHGESMGNVWPEAYRDDNKNFLSPYGVKQAELTGAYFKRMGVDFREVVSSNLTRARHTCAIILHEIGWQRAWLNVDALNEVNKEQDKERVRLMFRDVKGLVGDGGIGNVLVVTHYHTMQVMFDELTGGDRQLVDSYGGKHVGNASVFTWSPQDEKRIKLLDLTRTGDQH
jgi:broad specificity phosphatase PhoE